MAYKFTKPEHYERSKQNGSFRLGSLHEYRVIENEKARDELEGIASVWLTAPNKEIKSVLIGGKNYYVFCMRSDIPQGENFNKMQENFGKKLYKISSAENFARNVQNEIGAIRFIVRKIKYSNSKVLHAKVSRELKFDKSTKSAKYNRFFIDNFDEIQI